MLQTRPCAVAVQATLLRGLSPGVEGVLHLEWGCTQDCSVGGGRCPEMAPVFLALVDDL